MTTMQIDRAVVEQALHAMLNFKDDISDEMFESIRELKAALAQQAEPDLSRCPKCNGLADNGHDRSIPPNPYLCTRCMAEPVEPVAWRWGYRSVTTGEMDWRGYVEIAAHPNLRSPEIIMEPLYTAPPQRPPLTDEEIAVIKESCMGLVQYGGHENMTQERVFDVLAFARAVERKVRGELK